MNFGDIINSIPDLLLFVIPGYIVVRVDEVYSLKKRANSFDTILYSLLYSFVIGIVFSLISNIAQTIASSTKPFFENATVKHISYLLLSLIMGWIMVRLPKTGAGKLVLKKFNKGLVSGDSVWTKAMGNEKGAWATVYLANGLIYTGALVDYTTDPNENVKEILLEKYRLALRNTEPLTSSEDFSIEIEDYTMDESTKVFLSRDDIVSIEIHP